MCFILGPFLYPSLCFLSSHEVNCPSTISSTRMMFCLTVDCRLQSLKPWVKTILPASLFFSGIWTQLLRSTSRVSENSVSLPGRIWWVWHWPGIHAVQFWSPHSILVPFYNLCRKDKLKDFHLNFIFHCLQGLAGKVGSASTNLKASTSLSI